MTEENNAPTVETPTRRGRPRKPDAPKRERAGDLRARMNSAAILLLRAERASNPEVVKELLGAALETLKGDGE